MADNTHDENLVKKVYTKENTSETLAEVNDGVKTPLESPTAPPSDSAVRKARAGEDIAIPDQNGRNSQLGDAEKVEYEAVHNDQSAPDYRDEIYREKPVEGRIANN